MTNDLQFTSKSFIPFSKYLFLCKFFLILCAS